MDFWLHENMEIEITFQIRKGSVKCEIVIKFNNK